MKTGKTLMEEISKAEGRPAFWWLGQLGFAVKSCGKILYMDAFLSDMPERKVPPLVEPEELMNADFILGSHDHIDHIDWGVWGRIAKSNPKARFIAPKAVIDHKKELTVPADRLVGLDDGVSFESDGLKITGIAAAHEFLDRDADTGCCPYLGYVVETGDCVLYHSGDTCLYEGLADRLGKWKHIDVMFLPINGRDGRRYRQNIIGNMTYQEAVDLAGLIKPGLVVPSHYEMFSFNHEDPYLFEDYLTIKYPNQKYWIGSHGERTDIK